MIKAFSEASRTIQGIKVRPPKPAVSGKLIGKHSSDGFKLGLEKPFEKLPDVAAINLNRKFIGFELDDEYFKIAQDRIFAQRK